MSIKAVVFDIYKTVLTVGAPPPDAAPRWAQLCSRLPGGAPLSLVEFGAACHEHVAREHATAHAAGIAFPEVFWPDITKAVLPALATLTPKALDEFLLQHAQLVRRVALADGAADVLQFLRERGVPLGIASNAQPYTLHELDAALAEQGMSRALFEPRLCFWSFEAGFSKPDPHVFRWLTARLHALGVTPAETLMVGDRLDNDIEPARAQGWQTWQLREAGVAGETPGGAWDGLMVYLRQLL
ncbi:MAG: HAD family hydrolase [Verrucomicrobiota bacterium]